MVSGYVTEYGGMPGDATPQITASRDVTVTLVTVPAVTTAAPANITVDDGVVRRRGHQ